jgi:hypothetical protein
VVVEDRFFKSKRLQNTTHAFMAQRIEPKDSSDDLPTPPWATRGLMEHVLKDYAALSRKAALSQPCRHMVRALAEYFGSVTGPDVHDYG